MWISDPSSSESSECGFEPWSVMTPVSLSKALYHNGFSPTSIDESLSNLQWHPVQGESNFSQSFNANETR